MRRQFILFKPNTIDEACVHGQYIESDKKRGIHVVIKILWMKVLSNVDENIIYKMVHKEVSPSRLHHKEGNEMPKLFHINIQIKKRNIYALFDSHS
jgi:hypothetical protein